MQRRIDGLGVAVAMMNEELIEHLQDGDADSIENCCGVIRSIFIGWPGG